MLMKMYNIWYDIKETLKEKKGQGMVEYALIIGLIAVVVITVLTNMGTNIQGKFQEIVTKLAP
ncbi:MAG: Flp family type IVb pilin [Caulobacteraceae bacterium]